MALCPYCNSKISDIILREGGECPSCHEDILGGIFATESDEKSEDILESNHLDLNTMNLKESLFDVEDTNSKERKEESTPDYESSLFDDKKQEKDIDNQDQRNDIDLLSSEIEILSPPTSPKEALSVDFLSSGTEMGPESKNKVDIQEEQKNDNVLVHTGFLEEDDTEITNSGLFPKAPHSSNDSISKNDFPQENSQMKDELISPETNTNNNKSTTLPPKAVIPDVTNKTIDEGRGVLFQGSGVEKDVINSLKDHPFIDEEYIPVQEDLFDNEEISIIENFAFEEISEVEDIRKLYGVDESILFPSEQTKEIGLLQENDKAEANTSLGYTSNSKPHSYNKQNTTTSSTSRFHKSKSANESIVNDDLILDEDMINDFEIPMQDDDRPSRELKADQQQLYKKHNSEGTAFETNAIDSNPNENRQIHQKNNESTSKEFHNRDFDTIPDWVEDDWGDDFLDEELTEVTELDSSKSNTSNVAEVIRPDFQASKTQQNTIDKKISSKEMESVTAGIKRNKNKKPRSLTTSTIILYVLCFLLIVCISFLGFQLVGIE